MLVPLPSQPVLAAMIPDPVVQPEWLRTPKATDIFRAHPRDRRGHWVKGGATMICTITTTGTLTACRVTEERPQGAGMGAAVIKLAPLFQMRPLDLKLRPVVGRFIYIPVEF